MSSFRLAPGEASASPFSYLARTSEAPQVRSTAILTPRVQRVTAQRRHQPANRSLRPFSREVCAVCPMRGIYAPNRKPEARRLPRYPRALIAPHVRPSRPAHRSGRDQLALDSAAAPISQRLADEAIQRPIPERPASDCDRHDVTDPHPPAARSPASLEPSHGFAVPARFARKPRACATRSRSRTIRSVRRAHHLDTRVMHLSMPAPIMATMRPRHAIDEARRKPKVEWLRLRGTRTAVSDPMTTKS